MNFYFRNNINMLEIEIKMINYINGVSTFLFFLFLYLDIFFLFNQMSKLLIFEEDLNT